MLKMEQITFGYAHKRKYPTKQIFKNCSLSFEPGKMYALYGSSGAGKSTCLALLGGLEEPEEGRISVDGKDIREIGYSTLRKSIVSYVFQNFHLFSYMTAVENVMVVMSDKRKDREQNRRKAEEFLLKVGIAREDQNRPVFRLSGGQMQRVAIARALAADAVYILADEPTGNLDKDNTNAIMQIFRDLVSKEKKCVILASHDDAVIGMCDVATDISRLTQEKSDDIT